MKHITTLAAALAGVVIPLAACGTPVEEQPVRAEAPAISSQQVSAWQEYYDATHPSPGTKPAADHVSAWQEYYDATHP